MMPGEIALELCDLTDEQRRAVNFVLLRAASTRYISDSGIQDGYRELSNKCAELENGKSAAVTAERLRVIRLVEEEAIALDAAKAPAVDWYSVIRQLVWRIGDGSI